MVSEETVQPVYQNALPPPSVATRAARGAAAACTDALRRGALSSRGRTLLVAGLLLGLLAGVTQRMLTLEYRAEVGLILAGAQRTAQKLASRTTQVLDEVDRTTLLIKVLHERGMLPPLLSLHQSGLLANEVTHAVMLVDRKGMVVDNTTTASALNVADDDDFKRYLKQPELDVTLGASTVNHLGGGHMLPVSRRLGRPGTAFEGLVTAMVDPVALTAGFAHSEAADTAFGVLGLDGVFRSHIVDNRTTFGTRLDAGAVLANETAIRHTGEPVASPVDGVERFVASARAERHPVLAVVAVNARTALAEYRRARSHILGWAGALALCIAGATAALASQARQIEAGRERTRRAEAAFRATLEGSLDAVTILHPERGADGALADMRITDCNARAAQLVGRSRDDVLGQLLCELAPSIRSGGFLAAFDAAIAAQRSADGEVLSIEPHIAGRWLHHRIVPVADGIALISRDITERKTAEAQLESLARIDALTQLPNRRHFDERLPEALTRAGRSGTTLALLFIDLDGFKRINDTLGHAVGDRLLVEVAARLRGCVRGCDTVCRLGGDEFTVILEGAGSERQVRELCGRVLHALAGEHLLGGERVVATPSIGVALARPGEAPEALCERADAAMYAAKRAGKARFRLAGDGSTPAPAVDDGPSAFAA